ncbi:MAG: hypothetical protein J6Q22_10010 [Prevotella sp.]|nr:hypothetical protein [Prevotella sp.]
MNQVNDRIEWGRFFDRIYCVHFLPHKDRMKKLTEELERVGILDSGILEWRYTVPDRYEDIIWKVAEKNKWCSRRAYVNLALENHRILEEAILLGLNRILIIEDDILFLSSIREIKEILLDIPKEYGIVQFDKRANIPKGEDVVWEELLRRSKINDHYVRSTFNFPNATAMGYFHEGILDAFKVLDSRLCTPDRIMKFTNKPHAIAIKSMAIQKLYDSAINLSFNSAEIIHYQCYRQVGVNNELYGKQ